MRASPVALSALLALLNSVGTDAFTPLSLQTSSSSVMSRSAIVFTPALSRSSCGSGNTSLNMAGFLGQDEDDEDDEDDDDDDDDEFETSLRRSSSSTLTSGSMAGLKLDPWDPNPTIKPRPGRYGFGALETQPAVPDSELVQTMTSEERKENLKIMRQIKKFDLADLRLRKDHAGWVEANNDLKRREQSDPWFGLNERLKEATQLGEEEEATYLQALVDKLGGPPPGVKISPTRGYAVHTEIYDIGMSASRAASMLEQKILDERIARGRAMAAERRQNMDREQREWEEMMRNPGDREDKEAKARRERTMRRLLGEIEEDNKKRQERAKVSQQTNKQSLFGIHHLTLSQ